LFDRQVLEAANRGAAVLADFAPAGFNRGGEFRVLEPLINRVTVQPELARNVCDVGVVR
jgi:hypothetical protein